MDKKYTKEEISKAKRLALGVFTELSIKTRKRW